MEILIIRYHLSLIVIIGQCSQICFWLHTFTKLSSKIAYLHYNYIILSCF